MLGPLQTSALNFSLSYWTSHNFILKIFNDVLNENMKLSHGSNPW